MRVVMTLLARNEADVVDAQIAFHLHSGVDFFVATENRSADGTLEILERYERAGYLHLIRERGDDMRQADWVTHMARLAATEFDADWVVNSDADEFWWPRGGSIKDVFAAIPERYGVVRGCWRHFLPRPDGEEAFSERMTVRLCSPAFPGDKTTIFHAHQKVAHRANRDVTLEAGNHNAEGPGLHPLRGWHPLEVLHFSLRSAAQLETKAKGGWLRNPAYDPPLHQLLLQSALQEDCLEEYYDSLLVDDIGLEGGLADGTLAVDTRLRDALRALRGPHDRFLPPGEAPALTFAPPDVLDAATYASEASTLVEIDGIVRAEQRVVVLEERIQALERSSLPRLGSALARRIGERRVPRRLASR